jgi:hypothetical protein
MLQNVKPVIVKAFKAYENGPKGPRVKVQFAGGKPKWHSVIEMQSMLGMEEYHKMMDALMKG